MIALNASLLAWPAAVMRDRGAILDCLDIQAGGLQRGNRTLATAPRAFHANIDFLHPGLNRFFGDLLGSTLPGKRSALAAAFEAASSCARPANRVALGIGNRHRRIVERRIDMRDAHGNVLSNSLLLRFCHPVRSP